MRPDLVQQAQQIVKDPPLLINMVSRRVAQLNRGQRPLLAPEPGMGAADIALSEIIDGLIVVEEEEVES